MYVGLHVKYTLFLSDFMRLEFSRQIFENTSNTNFHENPSSGSRVVPCGRTEVTKLTVAFLHVQIVLKSGRINLM